MTTRVLLVDDVEQVRWDLRTALALSEDLEIVGEAANGLEALHLAETLRPEMTLLDLEMPLMDGYEATRLIRALCPSCRIFPLTVHAYDEARLKAVRSGVDAFLIKGAPIQEIVQTILKKKSEEMETKTTQRKFYLDWLRVMVILTVFVYHSARFFNLDGWHVKNPNLYWGVEIWEKVLATWMMPLCFIISGMSVFYALEKGRVGRLVKDKILRLFVPLIVGIFTHSVLQVYLERVSHGEFNGSFFDFYPYYFEGRYGFGGNFGWMGIHLWYLEMLFLFSLIFLPLFWILMRGLGQRLLTGLGNVLAVPGVAILLTFPLTLILSFVDDGSPLGMDAFGGWGILSHAWFFLSGFVIASNERMQESIRRMRWVWLIGAIALTVFRATEAVIAAQHGSFGLENTDLMAFLWILTFLGWARQRLNFGTLRLRQANEAVLPFYILHQPVLVGIGYFVVGWAIPDLAKWMIIFISSFTIILALYEFVVQRFNIMHILFGMHPLAKTSALEPTAVPAD